MSTNAEDVRLEQLVAGLELPTGAYEAATRRYQDLGDWFDRAECALAEFNPHIFVQGSFALGTAIRPLLEGEEYDLDLACELRARITRLSHTQEQVKDLVGDELQGYRSFRKIADPVEPKHRCWRLNYQDQLRFHLDVVPAIRAESKRQAELAILMESYGQKRADAQHQATEALWITDDRNMNYRLIDDAWLSSNPQGYQRWFVRRMEGTSHMVLEKAQVDDVPLYQRKTPLQRVVQLLKRHRDVMFQNNVESKPISIIITTIAAESYRAGETLSQSMRTVLNALEEFRASNRDSVPNPVDPAENFADRWTQPEYTHLRLKQNFHLWVTQARKDFRAISETSDSKLLVEEASNRFRVPLSQEAVTAMLAGMVSEPRKPHHVEITSAAPKPWSP
jgi:hypothetical protein